MKTASAKIIQQIYDRIGRRYDLFSFYEGKAKALALKLLSPSDRERILNAGVGTGKEHLPIRDGVGNEGSAIGLDLSYTLALHSQRQTRTPQIQANLSKLPIKNARFDAVYCAFVFDLLSPEDIHASLAQFRRVINPGGRIVICTLTSGEKGLSNIITALWEGLFRISPTLCAGCQPINLKPYLERASFEIAEEHFVTQLGVISQIILAYAN